MYVCHASLTSSRAWFPRKNSIRQLSLDRCTELGSDELLAEKSDGYGIHTVILLHAMPNNSISKISVEPPGMPGWDNLP